MATIVPSLKQDIFEEDVETGSAASEATMTKFAGVTNLNSETNVICIHFDIHGPYNIVSVPDNKVDKFCIIPFDCEIISSHFYVGENVGSSGNTEIDIVKKPLVGSEVSIFTTRPVIPFGVVEGDIIQEYLPALSTIRLASGGTIAVLTGTTLDKYDVLKFNIIAKPVGTIDKMGFNLIVRPR